ncbi:hypothetical protein B0H34DRAFT_522161 [Crassisporium funariophilum]|nr:hypothetical protein B0H34DRAFT_522161 [Crassisporium funariophilum]
MLPISESQQTNPISSSAPGSIVQIHRTHIPFTTPAPTPSLLSKPRPPKPKFLFDLRRQWCRTITFGVGMVGEDGACSRARTEAATIAYVRLSVQYSGSRIRLAATGKVVIVQASVAWRDGVREMASMAERAWGGLAWSGVVGRKWAVVSEAESCRGKWFGFLGSLGPMV